MPTGNFPRPFELATRIVLASLLVIGGVHLYQRVLVAPLIPAFRGALWLLSPEFTITSAEVTRVDENEVVRFRANLSVPLLYEGRMLQPFGWSRRAPQGGFQVTLTAGGILQYAALALILILAWPARKWTELGFRWLLAVPLLALLVLAQVPLTVAAELWNTLHNHYDPLGLCVWMIWSRFMMGGGGLVLAILLAGVTIGGGLYLTHHVGFRRSRNGPDSGYARLVLPRRPIP